MSTTACDGTWELAHAARELATLVRQTALAHDERAMLALRAIERALDRVVRGERPPSVPRDEPAPPSHA